MFKQSDKPEHDNLDKVITDALDRTNTFNVETDEFGKSTKHVSSLIEAKAKLVEAESKTKITPQQVLGIAATSATALVLANFERTAIITTKAMQFLRQIKF